LIPRFLLDTHIVVRWFATPKKLSREQAHCIREAVRRREFVALSAMTLLEIALLFGKNSPRRNLLAEEIFRQIQSDPAFQILPLTIDVATEVAAVGGSLRDPADRAIVCTARVHKLQLITSDQRIIDSKLVPVIV
jgi:PIN domain nuclease of toxin-antitoxin system